MAARKALVQNGGNYSVSIDENNTCIIEREHFRGFWDRVISLVSGSYKRIVDAFPSQGTASRISLEGLTINVREDKERIGAPNRVELSSKSYDLHYIALPLCLD